LERAGEFHPEAKPRLISDNGRLAIAQDFKEFIRISSMIPCRNFAPAIPNRTENRTLDLPKDVCTNVEGRNASGWENQYPRTKHGVW
jgi:hypothetical protein